jgi:ankyrin repeat protein
LQHLVEAAKLGHQPAMFYCRAFLENGILRKESLDTSTLIDHPFLSLSGVVSLMRSESEAAYQIRSAHTYWLRQSVSSIFLYDHVTITELTAERLLSVIDIGQFHHLEIESEAEGKLRLQPVLHHLARIDPGLVEELLQRGVDGSTVAADNETLLHVACESGSLKLVQTLLNFHPDLARTNTADGLSPLHWLFMFEDSEIPKVASALGSLTPLHDRVAVRFLRDLNLVFSGPPLHWAIMARNVPAVQALIDLGVDLNKMSHMPPDCLNYPPYAVDVASAFLMPEMVQLLQAHGAHLSHEDQETAAVNHVGDTLDPFRLWLYHGRNVDEMAQETVRLLLEPNSGLVAPSLEATAVANLISQTSCHAFVLRHFLHFEPSVSEQTLIFAAISFQHDSVNGEEMAIILGYCSSHMGQKEFHNGCIDALAICAEDGSVGAARVILDRLGNSAKAAIDDEGLIHKAAEYDHIDMIELLLAKGGDINLDLDGTPAATAAFCSKRKALRYLLSHGAKVVISGSDGPYTLLHGIVSNANPAYESVATLKMICEEFADLVKPVVDNYDRRGLTALHEAIIWANLKNIGRLIVDLHAKPLNIRDKDICPLGLVQLCKDFPPWLITQQGERALLEYQKSMDSVSEYLQHTIGLIPPRSVVPDEKVLLAWRKPEASQWRPSDGVWDWYIPDKRLDTISDRVKWWGVRWRPNMTDAEGQQDGSNFGTHEDTFPETIG